MTAAWSDTHSGLVGLRARPQGLTRFASTNGAPVPVKPGGATKFGDSTRFVTTNTSRAPRRRPPALSKVRTRPGNGKTAQPPPTRHQPGPKDQTNGGEGAPAGDRHNRLTARLLVGMYCPVEGRGYGIAEDSSSTSQGGSGRRFVIPFPSLGEPVTFNEDTRSDTRPPLDEHHAAGRNRNISSRDSFSACFCSRPCRRRRRRRPTCRSRAGRPWARSRR